MFKIATFTKGLWGLKNEPTLPPLPIYFSLEVRPYSKEEGMGIERLCEIEEHKNYVVFVKAHVDEVRREHLAQRKRTISEDGSLHLLCMRCKDGSEVSAVNISESIHPVSRSELGEDGEEFEHLFIISAIEKCENEDIRFELYYQRGCKQRDSDPIATLQIKLHGRYYPVDQKLFKPACIAEAPLQKPLPDNTCVVYVMNARDDFDETWMEVQGWSHFFRALPSTKFVKTPLTMNKFTQAKKDDIDNLITNLKEYWRNDAYDLCRWLVGQWIRLKKQNERLQVILVDHSNYQIPWETLVLTDRVYLGAEARVVRWKPIHTLSESRYLFYERDTAEIIQADVHHEAAIAYLDKEDVTKEPIGYPELATLKQINIHVFDTIADLKMRLMQPLTNVNFVYIGAHGSQGTEIGSRQLESERITQLHLASKETEREWRPLFFVNTCHSANLGTTTSGAKSGLLDVIMAYMACGYIGTLGAVGNKVATRVAERMLTEAMAPGGAYIAEILRDLREEIAGKIHAENFKILPQEEQAALQKDFFYVFMYVYYGNLVTRLHLQPKAASVEGGEHVARII